MASPFNLELISPERTAIKKPVVMVVVPSESGSYGVLAGHAPMITSMGPGVVEVYEKEDSVVTERFFVTAGFAEVTGPTCVLLAEGMTEVSKLDRTALLAEKGDLQAALAAVESEEDRKKCARKLAILEAKLEAAA